MVFHGLTTDDTEVAVEMLFLLHQFRAINNFKQRLSFLSEFIIETSLTLLDIVMKKEPTWHLSTSTCSMEMYTHLLDNGNVDVLSWEGRLKIALDEAQGLEYLHHGCKPPVVHTDVKTTNILLTGNFQAKIANVGLSRCIPTDGATHVFTVATGTPGYLDPEYYVTNRLNEKSDVYSCWYCSVGDSSICHS